LVETAAVKARQVRELPIVAGQLALDFANTIDDPAGPARHDHIATYPGLLNWSIRVGAVSRGQAERLLEVAASRPGQAGAALRRAHTLRRVVIATFTEVATGESSASRHWADLQPFVIDSISHAELVPAGSAGSAGPAYHLGWPDTDQLHAMLWPIAHTALDLLTGPDLHRVKRCAGCPWLFLDHSKNASRRWCAMNDCGTHAKIRRYVARRAARRAKSQ
jgi:predicted RNA-binding Zn ribbon-like protein